MLKKLISLLLASCMLFCLSACAKEKSNPQESNENSSNIFNSKQEVELYNATDFSEGKAVVIYQDINGSNYCNAGVLSSSGSITELKDVFVTILPEDDDREDLIATPSNWSGFTDGYAFIDYTDKTSDINTSYERFVIFDAKGNITAISPLDADYTILCGGDGLYLVKQETKTTMTEYGTTNIGIINYKGEWICPLYDPNNYYSTNITNLESATCEYLGEHIFAFTYDNYDTSFNAGFWLDLYNVDRNVYVEYEDMKMLSNFYEGKALLYKTLKRSEYNHTSSTDIYTIDSVNFKLKHLFSDISWGGYSGEKMILASTPIASEGYIFGIECYDFSQPYNAYLGPESIFVSAFFDMDGNSLIDLSEYEFYSISGHDVSTGFYRFIDGIAVIKISGKDGSYVTTINAKGEFLYKPIKAYGINYDKETNTIAAKIEQNIDGETCDRNAFINASTGEITIKDFETDGNWYSGYSKNYNYFINEDGEKLITYVN